MRRRWSESGHVWTLILLALAAIALLLPACNIVGPAYAIASGPPKKPAEFLIEDRPTLVFVDDRSNVLSRRNLRRQIADRASEELMIQEAVTRTISPRDGMAVALTETHNSPMPIDAIGRSVGADQVIYIEMVAFVLSADGTTPVPMARCAVKVIDVSNRQKLFPGDASRDEARMLDVTAGPVSMELYKSAATRRQIEDTLAEAVGTEIARLFFEHVPRELGRNLNTR